jgi:hypothetical protein
MARLSQAVLIVSTLLGSWLGMQAVHESGHVLGAWLTGGEVAKVVLHPLTISRTDLSSNPHPLVVVWLGPLVGVILPLLLWAIAAVSRMPGAFVARFFAGFCLIANGAYIGFGSLDRIGDSGEMLRHGSALWQLCLFGALTVPAGLLLWHRQGTHFGLGPAPSKVHFGVSLATAALCILLIMLGWFVDGE